MATLPDTQAAHAHQIQLESWLAAIRQQDAAAQAALQLLYQATSPRLFSYALRMLKRRELAEDVLQESYISIWNSAASYQNSLASPMTWMTTIVRNKAFDVMRRSEHEIGNKEIDADSFDQDVLHAMECDSPGPLQSMLLSSDAKALASCLSRLEGMHRQAIALAFFQDLSHSEVAAQLKLPIGTIKTWIRRGLERLRLCMPKSEAL